MVDDTPVQDEGMVQEQDRSGDMAEPGDGRRARRGRYNKRARLQDSSGQLYGDPVVLPRIKFRAILASSGDPIKIGQDGESKVSLEVSADSIAEVLKLILYRGRLFTVEVFSEP